MNASGMFVTLLYGILDCKTGHFMYSRAGHLPPMILNERGNRIEMDVDEGQPLGLFEEVKLDTQEVVIPRGGLALLFSDGLNEAADSQGNQFGFEGIQRELSLQRQESSRIICERLWKAVEAHSGDISHQDDFTVVVMKRLE
jgi:sigma-B regulation protein RsbU (phosphoserine phosphatase)